MKLKKLIPLVWVGAIIIPLVTSCAQNAQIQWNYTYKKGSTPTKYEAKFKTTTETIDSVVKAKQVYFDQLENNHKLYVDDIMYNISIGFLWEVEWLGYESIDGTVSINLTKFNKNTHEVNFSLSSEFTIKTKEDGYDVETSGVRKFSFYKIPVDVADADEGVWSVCPEFASSEIKNIYSHPTSWDEFKDPIHTKAKSNKDWYITYSDNIVCNHVAHSNTAKWTYDNCLEPVSRETVFGRFTPMDAIDVLMEFTVLGFESHFLNNTK